MFYFWLVLVFAIGACVGGLLNHCFYRLPLEKSILWPGPRCGRCLQPIRWFDNIPLLVIVCCVAAAGRAAVLSPPATSSSNCSPA